MDGRQRATSMADIIRTEGDSEQHSPYQPCTYRERPVSGMVVENRPFGTYTRFGYLPPPTTHSSSAQPMTRDPHLMFHPRARMHTHICKFLHHERAADVPRGECSQGLPADLTQLSVANKAAEKFAQAAHLLHPAVMDTNTNSVERTRLQTTTNANRRILLAVSNKHKHKHKTTQSYLL